MPLPLEVWLIHPEREMCDEFERRFSNSKNAKVIQARFKDLPPHDCFVTAANSFGIMNAGIDAAVIRKHGEALMKRIQHRILDQFLGEQPIGTSMIAETGNDDYPFVAHTPTMRVPCPIDGTDKVYMATFAALVEIYRHNSGQLSTKRLSADTNSRKIETAAFPAMGAGFGQVPYSEVARQMFVAYQHYKNPPHRFDWDMVAKRNKSIKYDGDKSMIS